VAEADFAPLDGEYRQALLRDVEYLRDELARPAARWRREVITSVLDWIESHFERQEEHADEHLPSLDPLRQALQQQLRG
jgi:tetrahydromethanopterin S-methyltransferase subunit B